MATDHKVLGKIAKLGTITGVQSWCKIWLLNGCNRIRAKPKSSQQTDKSFTKVSRSDRNICFGIIVHQRLTVPKQMVLLKEQWRIKERTSAVLQSGSDEKCWADSMECCCCLRNVQDLLADGKTLHERRFGEPFRGPIILVGSMVCPRV